MKTHEHGYKLISKIQSYSNPTERVTPLKSITNDVNNELNPPKTSQKNY